MSRERGGLKVKSEEERSVCAPSIVRTLPAGAGSAAGRASPSATSSASTASRRRRRSPSRCDPANRALIPATLSGNHTARSTRRRAIVNDRSENQVLGLAGTHRFHMTSGENSRMASKVYATDINRRVRSDCQNVAFPCTFTFCRFGKLDIKERGAARAAGRQNGSARIPLRSNCLRAFPSESPRAGWQFTDPDVFVNSLRAKSDCNVFFRNEFYFRSMTGGRRI